MDRIIRELKRKEFALLRDFLYEAIFIPQGAAVPPHSVIELPELQVYIADFGMHKGDRALAAEVQEKVVGVIWVRIMHDYGHIDADTPSLAMSIAPDYRGQGIGTLLLSAMCAALRTEGVARVSLSVQKANYAVRLYRKAGFRVIEETEEEYIMCLDL